MCEKSSLFANIDVDSTYLSLNLRERLYLNENRFLHRNSLSLIKPDQQQQQQQQSKFYPNYKVPNSQQQTKTELENTNSGFKPSPSVVRNFQQIDELKQNLINDSFLIDSTKLENNFLHELKSIKSNLTQTLSDVKNELKNDLGQIVSQLNHLNNESQSLGKTSSKIEEKLLGLDGRLTAVENLNIKVQFDLASRISRFEERFDKLEVQLMFLKSCITEKNSRLMESTFQQPKTSDSDDGLAKNEKMTKINEKIRQLKLKNQMSKSKTTKNLKRISTLTSTSTVRKYLNVETNSISSSYDDENATSQRKRQRPHEPKNTTRYKRKLDICSSQFERDDNNDNEPDDNSEIDEMELICATNNSEYGNSSFKFIHDYSVKKENFYSQ